MTPGPDPRRLVTLALTVVLAGATAFGLWHVVIGGWFHDNLLAGAFGVILATAAGSLLSPLLATFGRRATG